MSSAIHDSGYKRLFSNRTIFRQFIETFVHEDWVQDLDFSQAETLDKSFVSAHYKETESDLIYKVKFHGHEAYLVLLLEFQTTVERFMALRVLNYVTNFYMDYVESVKHVNMLPPVFPIVLYRGKAAWNAPVNMTDLIDDVQRLGPHAPHFQYCKIVEHEYPPDMLLKIRNIVSTLFFAETSDDENRIIDELATLFDREEDRQAAGLLVNWFVQLITHDRKTFIDTELLQDLGQTGEEVKTMLAQTLENKFHDIERRTWDKALEKGEIIGTIRTLQRVLGQPISLEQDLREQAPDELQRLLDELNATLSASMPSS